MTQCRIVAVYFGRGRVGAAAVFAMAAGTAAVVCAGLDLAGGGLAGRAGKNSVHKTVSATTHLN